VATAQGESTEAYERLSSFAAQQFSGAREGRPSLLQDAMKGRRTEVEYLNGLVAKKGREVGIATPANEAITTLVKQLEMGEIKPDPANLEHLRQFT
jgi:2-dehydropantoate 2-reductase